MEIFAKESNRSNQILLKRSQIWFSKKNRHWFASFFIISLRRSFLENWISGLTGISSFFYKICCNVNRRFCKQQFLHLSSFWIPIFLMKGLNIGTSYFSAKTQSYMCDRGRYFQHLGFLLGSIRCSKLRLKIHIKYFSSIINTILK